MNKHPFNYNAMQAKLESARYELGLCINKIASEEYGEDDYLVMASDFQNILYKIWMAWHYKYMSDEEINELTREEFLRLSRTVPNFGLDLELMEGI
jgi:hypothetical protein